MAFPSEVDYLVMGAGVAGLRAAVELADEGEVLVITKESLGESNTHYAQGGIAVAQAEDREDLALHVTDTVLAGDGLVYGPAAQVLVSEGPQRVAELIDWGTCFDSESGRLLRTREGAHSRPRILHANGDATGAEISRSLVAHAHAHPRIRFAEWTMVTRLFVADGCVMGAELTSANTANDDNGPQQIGARAILIASGGAGQVYSDTTNPSVATGDGLALALHAGAELADMEFYQFHPTAFSLEGASRFLLSEALRGEGAHLRNDRGERFMERYHPLLELAPRDVVARAITHEGMDGDSGAARAVYLDMRHVKGVDLHQRFPGISSFLARYSFDLERDLVPVRPAAHYLMGGIRTDLQGRTSVRGLYAAGEAACTGVHGANRLASNSLLEGLVFGARAAKAMLEDKLPLTPIACESLPVLAVEPDDTARIEGYMTDLRRAMWSDGGLLRSATTLQQGLAVQAECETGLEYFAQQRKRSRTLFEAQSLACVARAILFSALGRQESRGAHFRNDFPHHDDARFLKHSSYSRDGSVRFEAWQG
ncbi:MAG TPA: L-aspartate oxidase [Terracidiphilus sp.]|jgi:L-aspartate oxidase